LLDYAEYLSLYGDADAAALAIDEARGIGHRLRCQPLLDRAAGTPAALEHLSRRARPGTRHELALSVYLIG
jgi:signal transduction histidine kinase